MLLPSIEEGDGPLTKVREEDGEIVSEGSAAIADTGAVSDAGAVTVTVASTVDPGAVAAPVNGAPPWPVSDTEAVRAWEGVTAMPPSKNSGFGTNCSSISLGLGLPLPP